MLKEKSRIAEDIQKDGKFVNTVPFRDFYTEMASYSKLTRLKRRCALGTP